MKTAAKFAKMGLPVIGVPKTIDNDLVGTDFTFGFDTAVTTATEAIDKDSYYRKFASSHNDRRSHGPLRRLDRSLLRVLPAELMLF